MLESILSWFLVWLLSLQISKYGVSEKVSVSLEVPPWILKSFWMGIALCRVIPALCILQPKSDAIFLK